MNQEVKKLWTDALRSGRYEQGQRRLRRDEKYCCLGVLCELAIRAGVEVGKTYETVSDPDGGLVPSVLHLYGGMSARLPSVVRDWAELEPRDERSLSFFNDSGLDNFNDIASLIEIDL